MKTGVRLTLGAVVIALAASAGAAWFYGRLRAALPRLDGTEALAGLSAPVRVERDALGVPTITGRTRADVARALGFLHGEDRFFQMDVLRRRASGELAELFGKAALPIDEEVRRHGFRALARQVVARASPSERAVLEAYSEGVNAGLSALGAKPFEYYLLRTKPRPWLPEDCALIDYAMILNLQDDSGRPQHTLTTIRDVLGSEAVDFFAPISTPQDAALDGTTGTLPPPPSPAVIDLRKSTAFFRSREAGYSAEMPSAGSNSLAVAGRCTATGSAIVANDMHLDLSVPNIWYRARLKWGGVTGTAPHDITGVTLPGTPLVVAGSNGHVAWGFTNACIQTGDLVTVPMTESPEYYHVEGPEVMRRIDRRKETILVKGGDPVSMEYPWTMWGPIVGADLDGRPFVYHWIAYDPAAVNFKLIGLEDAGTVEQAIAVAHQAGIPAQNFLVADSSGRIAWTIAGPLPKRVGYDGRFPVTWVYGDRRWDGFLPAREVPALDDPARSYLWTANNRIVGGPALALLPDGNYDRPARAAQIRDGLASLVSRGHPATPADLLKIELDDRARFLEPWQRLLLDILTPGAVARSSSRAREREAVEAWGDAASVDSTGYAMVRDFRLAVAHRVLDPIFAPCVAADPGFSWDKLKYEGALWTLLRKKPIHLLSPQYASWDALLLDAADDAAKEDGGASWGRLNTLRMRHPLSRFLPAWLTTWLDMPAEPLPGDIDMPRVQSPSNGASERFAVSPGHEDQGVFEMPGGESGNPLSPFYRAGHEAWVRGEPTPFLPGPAERVLSLTPQL